MTRRELCARNVSAALREAENALNCCLLDEYYDEEIPLSVREAIKQAKARLEVASQELGRGA